MSTIEHLVDSFIQQLKTSRLPILEPNVFDGDIFSYHGWRHSISIIIDNKPLSGAAKLYYVSKYLSPKIKETIEGYLWLSNDSAYEHTLAFLDKRYGDPRLLAHAYRKKLDSWPLIKKYDGPSLQKFSDFLLQCQRVKADNGYLDILDNEFENQKLLSKLPVYLVREWIEIVHGNHENEKQFPDFSTFVNFVKKEADILCNPIFQGINPTKESCLLCDEYHNIGDCFLYKEISVQERKQLCVSNGLCFTCLQEHHQSKQCKSGQRCKLCSKGHSTTLHGAFSSSNKSKSRSYLMKRNCKQGSAQDFSHITPKHEQVLPSLIEQTSYNLRNNQTSNDMQLVSIGCQTFGVCNANDISYHSQSKHTYTENRKHCDKVLNDCVSETVQVPPCEPSCIVTHSELSMIDESERSLANNSLNSNNSVETQVDVPCNSPVSNAITSSSVQNSNSMVEKRHEGISWYLIPLILCLLSVSFVDKMNSSSQESVLSGNILSIDPMNIPSDESVWSGSFSFVNPMTISSAESVLSSAKGDSIYNILQDVYRELDPNQNIIKMRYKCVKDKWPDSVSHQSCTFSKHLDSEKDIMKQTSFETFIICLILMTGCYNIIQYDYSRYSLKLNPMFEKILNVIKVFILNIM